MLILRSCIECPVYYEDTDFSGFVYHANYLKFFERGREHVFGQPLLKHLIEEYNINFVVQHIDMDFKKPARFADLLRIESECEVSKSPRMSFVHKAIGADSGDVYVAARIDVVTLNVNGRPVRQSEDILEVLRGAPGFIQQP